MSRGIRLGLMTGAIAIATFAGYEVIRGWRGAILTAGVTAIGIVFAFELYRSLGRLKPAGPSAFDRALTTWRTPARRPADLVALERSFGWLVYSADEFEQRIKPVLTRLHRHVLAERTGRRTVPAFAGELAVLDPAASPPDGMDTAALERIVDAIEELR